jgi:4,5-DOPA dioxygenase extradiol
MSGDIDFEGLDIRYSGDKMPALFVAHGNSMSAIEETEYSRAWKSLEQSLPRSEGILCMLHRTYVHCTAGSGRAP